MNPRTTVPARMSDPPTLEELTTFFRKYPPEQSSIAVIDEYFVRHRMLETPSGGKMTFTQVGFRTPCPSCANSGRDAKMGLLQESDRAWQMHCLECDHMGHVSKGHAVWDVRDMLSTLTELTIQRQATQPANPPPAPSSAPPQPSSSATSYPSDLLLGGPPSSTTLPRVSPPGLPALGAPPASASPAVSSQLAVLTLDEVRRRELATNIHAALDAYYRVEDAAGPQAVLTPFAELWQTMHQLLRAHGVAGGQT